MKQLIYIISFLVSAVTAAPAFAVTEKEMEEARTIAAQVYLRYANDGSGYLDETHPKTMAELERVLKAKEKENLKAFKAIAVPKDYASWDKAKLVEYWGETAFSTKGLLEKGKIGKSRAKKRLNAMTVSAPVAASDTKQPAAPAESGKDKEAVPATQPLAAADSTSGQPASDIPATDSIGAEAAAGAANDDSADEEIPKAKDNTWIYVVVLIILVGVVVALVVFASNVMKKNGAEARANRRHDEDDVPQGPDAEAMREKFAASLNAKNNEIHSLNKKVEELLSQNQTLKANLEALTTETASLRSRLTEATRKLAAMSGTATAATPGQPTAAASGQPAVAAPGQPAAAVVTPSATFTQPQRRPQPKPAQPQGGSLRTIFLGKANAKGIFVRADRTLNAGNSIYRLDTTDGFAGTFRVVNDPTVWETALLSPRESLAGACVCADFDDTTGKERIVNDSSGTAIFESGCWKVIRKAKIHYE